MTGRSRALVVALVVFALAIGVLIGSGPLRSAITGGSVTADELADARAAAKAADAEAALGHDFADAVGPAAVEGRLNGVVVAVVRTADATDEDLAAATDRIDESGAMVGARVAITDEWTADDRGPFRDALAEQIASTLAKAPSGATTSQVLSAALAQALAPGDRLADPQAKERSDTLWSLLKQAGLVTGDRALGATLFVLVAPGGDVSDLAGAFEDSSHGAVVGFTGDVAGPAGGASTVTDAASFFGAWAIVGAAISAYGGESAAYDASDAAAIIGGLSG